MRNIISRSALSCAVAVALGGLAVTGGCSKDGAAGGSGGSGNPASKASGTIGFVDLDRVSSQIGWKSAIDDDFKAAQGDLTRELQVYQGVIQTAWDNKKKSIASAAHLTAEQQKTFNGTNAQEIQKLPFTQDQKDDLAQCLTQANNEFNRVKQLADRLLSEREGKILESYREAMKPAVRRVAVSANLSMVISPAPNANPVFYYDPSVDLTDQVVDDIRKAMPQHAMPEMPKLNLPPEIHFSPPTTSAGPIGSVLPTTQPK